MVKGGEGPGEGRGRITLNHDPIGAKLIQHCADTGEDSSGYVGQVLVRPHQLEVPIRPQVKKLEDLRQHLAMLTGNADLAVETGPSLTTGASLIASGRVPKTKRIFMPVGPSSPERGSWPRSFGPPWIISAKDEYGAYEY
jgi:hypothetical protein